MSTPNHKALTAADWCTGPLAFGLPTSKLILACSVISGEMSAAPQGDWRAAKQLEEARKSGAAPPATDEDGNEINPHIPQFIAKVPWFYGKDEPSLKHQRGSAHSEKDSSINVWYQRGKFKGPAATKYRKGACSNCGAMTHKAKDCVERPRKKGAKWKPVDIKVSRCNVCLTLTPASAG